MDDSEPHPWGSRADAHARPRQQQQQQSHLPPQLPPQLPPHQPSSPAFSRISSFAANTPTPLAERPGDGYFDTLSQAPSQPERLSTLSSSRFPSLIASDSRHRRLDRARSPSIRIRRSTVGLNGGLSAAEGPVASYGANDDAWHQSGRPRSVSQPSSAHLPAEHLSSARNSRRPPQGALPRLTEEGARPTMGELGITGSPMSPTVSVPEPALSNDGALGEEDVPVQRKPSRLARVSKRFWPGSRKRDADDMGVTSVPSRPDDEYDAELVDWLDIIDPEVQTLSTLTNVQNSLFIPDLGGWINRRPTYVLSERDMKAMRPASAGLQGRGPEPQQEEEEVDELEPVPEESELSHPGMHRSNTITSRLTDSHYAALPHGESLEGWSVADKWELDDHVRHMLHSRRSRFKRTMKGFGQYVRRPLGFFVTLYATLITLFGLAWVLFLIGWIYVGEKQVYAIHVIDSVLVALFAVMGDGLAPFRIIDTYHMIFVVRYSRMIKNGGKKPRNRLQKRMPSYVRESIEVRSLAPSAPVETAQGDPFSTFAQPPMLTDDDRPDMPTDADLEEGKPLNMPGYDPLTPKQRKSLLHHQKKLANSHSFYKPDETYTHHSFPLKYLMAIVILLDCHSCLQISLGACTWGIDYHVRPFALTTVILCVSITCNLTAGLVITIGDRKTRKKDVKELLNRQELTGDAIKHIEHKKKKEQEKGGEESDQNGLTSGSGEERDSNT